MATFSINPVGSYGNWPERQHTNDRRKPRRKTKRESDDTEPSDEKEDASENDGPVGHEIDIEV